MTYKEYMEKHHYCFGHDDYSDEQMFTDLHELLECMQEEGLECPQVVKGGIPVKVMIDPDWAVDGIEDNLYENDFAGEDYEMPEDGVEFLKKCFREYNEKYANYGYYCETVPVTVPDEMKYELEE